MYKVHILDMGSDFNMIFFFLDFLHRFLGTIGDLSFYICKLSKFSSPAELVVLML